MLVRPLARSDWPDVARIYGGGLASGVATFETRVPSWETWDTTHLPAPRLVAERDGAVVGWVAVSRVSRRPAYSGVVEHSVYVDDSARRSGVGRALLDSCWDAARLLEIKTVFTLTYVADFFEKCGYHRIEKADLPHKIWNECVRCPLFPNCNEIALIRSFEPDPAAVEVVDVRALVTIEA